MVCIQVYIQWWVACINYVLKVEHKEHPQHRPYVVPYRHKRTRSVQTLKIDDPFNSHTLHGAPTKLNRSILDIIYCSFFTIHQFSIIYPPHKHVSQQSATVLFLIYRVFFFNGAWRWMILCVDRTGHDRTAPFSIILASCSWSHWKKNLAIVETHMRRRALALLLFLIIYYLYMYWQLKICSWTM